MEEKNNSVSDKLKPGCLEIIARLVRFGKAVNLNSLMSCDFECLSDLQEKGLVSEKIDEHLVTYQLSPKGAHYINSLKKVQYWEDF